MGSKPHPHIMEGPAAEIARNIQCSLAPCRWLICADRGLLALCAMLAFYFSYQRDAIKTAARNLRPQHDATEIFDVSNKSLWSGGVHINHRFS